MCGNYILIPHYAFLIAHYSLLLSLLPSVIRALLFQLYAKCSYPLHSKMLFLSIHPPFQKKKKVEGGGCQREEKKGAEKPTLSILFFSVLGGVCVRFWLLDGFCSNKQSKIQAWKGTFKGAISCLKYYLSNCGYGMFSFSFISRQALLGGQTAAMRTWYVILKQENHKSCSQLT